MTDQNPRPDSDPVGAVLDEVPGLRELWQASEEHRDDDSWNEALSEEEQYALDWLRVQAGDFSEDDLREDWHRVRKPRLRVSKAQRKAIESAEDVARQRDLGRPEWQQDDRLTRVDRDCLEWLWGEAVMAGSVHLARAVSSIAKATAHDRKAVGLSLLRLEDADYLLRWRWNKGGGNFRVRGKAEFYAKQAGRGKSKQSPAAIWWLKQPWWRDTSDDTSDDASLRASH